MTRRASDLVGTPDAFSAGAAALAGGERSEFIDSRISRRGDPAAHSIVFASGRQTFPVSEHRMHRSNHASGSQPASPVGGAMAVSLTDWSLVRLDAPAKESPEAAAARQALPRGLGAILELSKPRITRLVVLTAAVGFVLAIAGQRTSITTLGTLLTGLGCIIGTALSASGANSLNQWWEYRRDALMPRTRARPIPTGRLSPDHAVLAGVLFSIAGVVTLWFLCGPAAATVSLVTILIYVLLYTPMKPVTPLSTLVGAVPGALPPLIGWCAGRTLTTDPMSFASLAEWGGWSLFGLMFVWQIPHFLAIAWMYRDDYAQGGFKMLPIFDRSGHLTSFMVAAWAVLLIPATVAPAFAMPDRLGPVYVAAASFTSLVFLASTVQLMLERSRARARAVFIGSIIHLPLLLLFMVGESVLRALLR